MFILPWVAWKS
jgi:hypothetical protein